MWSISPPTHFLAQWSHVPARHDGVVHTETHSQMSGDESLSVSGWAVKQHVAVGRPRAARVAGGDGQLHHSLLILRRQNHFLGGGDDGEEEEKE